MLSELQHDKISHYFRVVLDQDRNGVLQEKDFREISESLCILWRFKPDTDNYERVIREGRRTWELFKEHFEKEGGEATEYQFLKFYETMLGPEGEELYEKFVTRTVSSIFDSFDLNGDGVISINEYSDMFMCYHIPIKYSAKAFVKLDRNGDDHITKQELMEAVDEFFKSSNPKSPGNWLFGFWGDRD